jgi:hypothetical protein
MPNVRQNIVTRAEIFFATDEHVIPSLGFSLLNPDALGELSFSERAEFPPLALNSPSYP